MADTPEAILDEFEAAMTNGDDEAMVALYEDDALMVVQEFGIVARGRAAIRETFRNMKSMGEGLGFSVTSHPISVVGDYAFGHLLGEVRVKTPEDEEVAYVMDSREVFHRGPDGVWRYLADIG